MMKTKKNSPLGTTNKQIRDFIKETWPLLVISIITIVASTTVIIAALQRG